MKDISILFELPADRDKLLVHNLAESILIERVSPYPQIIEVREICVIDESRGIIAVKAHYRKEYLKQVMTSIGCKEVSDRDAATAYSSVLAEEKLDSERLTIN